MSETLRTTFNPSDPRGLANLLTMTGAVAPRFTFGPYAAERMRAGGGTGIREGFLTAGQLVRGTAEEQAAQKGMSAFLTAMSGKSQLSPEVMATIPPELLGPLASHMLQQADEQRGQHGIEALQQTLRERETPTILGGGGSPSNVAPFPQDSHKAVQAFSAPPSPSHLTINDVLGLYKYGPSASKVGESLYKSGLTEEHYTELADLKGKQLELQRQVADAKNATQLYGIEQKYAGLQQSLDAMKERLTIAEAGKTSRLETAEQGKLDRQVSALTQQMDRLEKSIAAKHEDVATQESGKGIRQRERLDAPPKPGKLAQGDKAVAAWANVFRGLKDIPSQPGRFYGEYPGKTAQEQALERIKEESGKAIGATSTSVLLRAFQEAFGEGKEQGEVSSVPLVPPPAPRGGPVKAARNPLEGRTATGPNGQKLIYRNGQWKPLNSQ